MVRPLGEHNPIPCFSVGRVVDLDELGEAQLEQAKLIQVDITYHDNKTRRL
ncbi:hypothetical protein HN958_01800 [Candidatus Falkowbacteria bacterium]|nr:hypothetical protein [Candidatus Falkowbacteria bacterium]MBT7007218.1 hypothetical protein [Candidatus Falkowbacteria bacterium]